MYAKIFAQIYDGTLCTKGPWQALVTFQQLLVLADQEGNVDMTAAAISRRTTIPLEIISMGIEELLKADPESRTPTEDGRRILPLCDGRAWGWKIVNYKHYRALKREEERREYHRNYWHKRKDKAATKTQAAARSAVYNALNAGTLKQGDCAECGAFPTEAHHENYNKPLEVIWLCKKHHEERHHNPSTIPSTNQPNTTPSTGHNTLNGNQPIAEAEAYAEAKRKTYDARAHLLSVGVTESTINDWFAIRKAKKLPASKTAIGEILKEIGRTDYTPEDAFRECCARGWAGFKADWIDGARNGKTGNSRAGGVGTTIAELTGANRNRSPVIEGTADRVD